MQKNLITCTCTCSWWAR